MTKPFEVWTAVAGQQTLAISRARKKAQAPGGIGGVIVPELGVKKPCDLVTTSLTAKFAEERRSEF